VHRVKATREGLAGRTTASGYAVDAHVPFVALPSTAALFHVVRVANTARGINILALVLDVGPWNTDDDDYVFGEARPQAESGVDTRGRVTNGAGIDLSEHVWNALDLVDNALVSWDFVF
jgi:hypothetical protein